jgi:hypothetical protein
MKANPGLKIEAKPTVVLPQASPIWTAWAPEAVI